MAHLFTFAQSLFGRGAIGALLGSSLWIAVASFSPPTGAQQPREGEALTSPGESRPPAEEGAPPAEEGEIPGAPEEGAPSPTIQDGNPHRITGFRLVYDKEVPEQIPIEDIFNRVSVELLRTSEGFIAPLGRAGPREKVMLEEVPSIAKEEDRFFLSAVQEIMRSVVGVFGEREQVVILVVIDENDIDAQGNDIRPPERTSLTLKVITGVATEIRTLASGDRVSLEARKDHPKHQRIKDRSPIQYGSPIYKDLLDAYIYDLNRHPGRRVDVALSRGKEKGGVALDYLVYENRPWLLYAEVSNTGTETTNEWRERFGFVDNQLTGHDDILSLQYITGGFEEVHAFVGSYDAPVFGVDKLRWQLNGNWSQFDASEVGQFNERFNGDQATAGGDLYWNFFQYEELFVDFFAGGRWQNIEVETESTGITGRDDFVLPRAGLRLEWFRDRFSLAASADVDWNLLGLFDGAEGLDRLGRINAEDDWVALHWSIYHSHFLDPYFFGEEWQDVQSKKATLAHEVVAAFEGQHAFSDARLVPQYERILGGLYTVRGYPESVAAGDTAFNLRFEYLFHLPRSHWFFQLFGEPAEAPVETSTEDPGAPRQRWKWNEPVPLLGRPFRYVPQQAYGRADWDLVLRAFFDFGQTINNDREPFEKDETLLGTGVGLEFLFKRNFSARMDWGVALSDVDISGKLVTEGSNRFHLAFTLLF